jgi:hypothetical protein
MKLGIKIVTKTQITVGFLHFGRNRCLKIMLKTIIFCLVMLWFDSEDEGICSFEMLVYFYRIPRRHIPEDSTAHGHTVRTSNFTHQDVSFFRM